MRILLLVIIGVGVVGACVNKILDLALKHYQDKLAAAKEKLASNELDSLVRQERIKQAVSIAPLVALNLPVDVKAVTLMLHYEDGTRLSMDCGRPQRAVVEP